MKIRIGTRTSALALKQTEIVIDEIKKRFPSAECEIVGISTKGDKILDKPVLEFGGKGVFVEEIEKRRNRYSRTQRKRSAGGNRGRPRYYRYAAKGRTGRRAYRS